MQLYTSYFAKIKTKSFKESGLVPISIAGKTPDGIELKYKPLAPRWEWWPKWGIKSEENINNGTYHNNDWYVEQYNNQLSELDVIKVINDLFELSNGKPFVLYCYEKTWEDDNAEVMKFCHRHIAAEWLSNGTDYDIVEFGI